MPTPPDKQKRTVFIVDDHPLVREWLSMLINQQSDLATCGEASSAMEALERVALLKPRIVVVDLSLAGSSGIELIQQIKASCPEVATVVLSMHDEALYAERALRAGARGYVMKREVTGRILEAIRCVLGGGFYLSEQAAALMAEKWVSGNSPTAYSPVELLSNRELEVFELLGRGRTNRQIAEEINVSFGTVQAFCGRIKEKLGLNNATELLREAVRWNERRGPR